MNPNFIARRPLANLSLGNTGLEPDALMTTAEIMEQFGISRDRVSKLARDRKWRFVTVGRSSLFYRADVQEEATRRQEKGLKA